MQHMDYDQFAQMVLGAHLKPMKQGSATRIYDPTQGGNLMNPHSNLQKILNKNYEEKVGYNEEVVKETLAMAKDEALTMPANQEEFELFVSRKC